MRSQSLHRFAGQVRSGIPEPERKLPRSGPAAEWRTDRAIFYRVAVDRDCCHCESLPLVIALQERRRDACYQAHGHDLVVGGAEKLYHCLATDPAVPRIVETPWMLAAEEILLAAV